MNNEPIQYNRIDRVFEVFQDGFLIAVAGSRVQAEKELEAAEHLDELTAGVPEHHMGAYRAI
tara:strand:+ start:845 stop:1030 length:186 start_codon:yes stop_codon:yes gene_type:complete